MLAGEDRGFFSRDAWASISDVEVNVLSAGFEFDGNGRGVSVVVDNCVLDEFVDGVLKARDGLDGRVGAAGFSDGGFGVVGGQVFDDGGGELLARLVEWVGVLAEEAGNFAVPLNARIDGFHLVHDGLCERGGFRADLLDQQFGGSADNGEAIGEIVPEQAVYDAELPGGLGVLGIVLLESDVLRDVSVLVVDWRDGDAVPGRGAVAAGIPDVLGDGAFRVDRLADAG